MGSDGVRLGTGCSAGPRRAACEGACAPRARGGFTLIEMLAAVVVLLLMILAIGRIYASSTKVYQETMKQAERDAAARAAMDFISREISLALFDDGNIGGNLSTNALLTMRYRANITTNNFGLEGADDIWFLATSQSSKSENPRELTQISYFVQNYESLTDPPANARYRFGLWRDYQHPQNKIYWNSYWGGTNGLNWCGVGTNAPTGLGNARDRRSLIIENVRTFEIFAYSDPYGTRVYNWDSRGFGGSGNQPLFCMDIYLETLSEADAIRAAQLAATLGPNNTRTIEFVESVVRRHYQRIYFPHKFSYFDRGYP